MEFINVNGKIVDREKAFIRADNHSYRYGDGLFETMKVMDGRILLSDLHFERLFDSLSILKLKTPKLFTAEYLAKEIIKLCQKNNCGQMGRVRLSVSGGNGGLYDSGENIQYLIECWPLLTSINQLNENGLVIGIFPDAKKTCDVFSHLKSASHLPYVVAARFAKENKLNDCLLLNSYDRICDSTIANLFWIKDKEVLTPPLSEGCISGVMRKHLVKSLQDTGYKAQEKLCEIADLENADEIFLTNAIQGMRWVKEFRHKIYANTITKDIYRRCIDV